MLIQCGAAGRLKTSFAGGCQLQSRAGQLQ
jgi:hypothetical protein